MISRGHINIEKPNINNYSTQHTDPNFRGGFNPKQGKKKVRCRNKGYPCKQEVESKVVNGFGGRRHC